VAHVAIAGALHGEQHCRKLWRLMNIDPNPPLDFLSIRLSLDSNFFMADVYPKSQILAKRGRLSISFITDPPGTLGQAL
jgi:hypothetical protein